MKLGLVYEDLGEKNVLSAAFLGTLMEFPTSRQPATFALIVGALLLAGVFLTSCQSGSVRQSVTRAECLRIAESYRVHTWTATADNVRHGNDADGVRVDTPDENFSTPGASPGWWKVGARNTGVPYQWGGICTLAQFDEGVAAGRAAGDIYTERKRALLDGAVSREAVGIDCSGYISRCWKLPRAYSTRELPTLCQRLHSWDELQPGDLLNTHNAHCLLFAGWEDGKRRRLIAYETGSPPTWKVLRHGIDVAWLKAEGYQAFRYRGLR